jgi:hypothetical protein
MKTNLKTPICLAALLGLTTLLCAADPTPPIAPATPEANADIGTNTNKEEPVSVSISASGVHITAPDQPGTVLGIPKDILDKMPPEEVARLAQKQAELRMSQSHSEDTLIPIVAIIFTFGMPVAIVAIVVISRHRRKRMLHETIRAMIEKGVTIPPELLQSEHEPKPGQKNDFRNGLVLIAVGLGLTLSYAIKGYPPLIAGLIPLLIGVAFLVTWKVAGSKNGQKPS